MESDKQIIGDLLSNLSMRHLMIIGQSAEKAIIFCFHTQKRRIICFDQHAIDERLRYEQILSIPNQKLKPEEAKSLACHGAIRFGDKLTNIECYNLVSRVLNCQEPFRCAHDRLSVCVLDTLDKLYFSDTFLSKCVLD